MASIEVVRIAANVCSRCRLHKQRCNRALPRCSRCALKLRHCDYDPPPSNYGDLPQPVCGIDSLVISEPCGIFDLSSRGEIELLQLIPNYAKDINTALRSFAQLTSDILQESNVDIPGLLDRFSSSTHRWFPVIDLDRLREDAQTLRDSRTEDASTPLLILALLLFESLQSSDLKISLGPKRLYTTSKTLMLVLISLGEKPNPRHVEMQALIGLYECSQGMVYQAHLTLSSALTTVTLSESYTQETEVPFQTKVSLVILDRMIMLSSEDNSIPSLCNPNSPFNKNIESYVRRHFVGESASFGASPCQQLYTMAQIALASGRVLHHVYCSHHCYEVDESYISVENDIQALVAALMAAKDSHSMYLCDTISLALCSLIVLHHSHAKQLRFILSSWDDLKLQTSRQMIWDTAKISFHGIKNADPSQVSLVGMFCQLRSVYSAIDASGNNIPYEQMGDMLVTMENFFQRWTIGAKLLRRVRAAVERSSTTTAFPT